MFISRPSSLIQKLYPSLVWKIPKNGKEFFLTFDDGPTPRVTEIVLNLLKQYDAKATFFCLGKNIEAYPEIFERIKKEGHSIGNHGYQHLNGWNNSNDSYLQDVLRADKIMKSRLFRPPYGKIKSGQIRLLKEKFDIVMWSVLSRDYNQNYTREKCWEITKKGIVPGAIVVFHDSVKAENNMVYTLEKTLEYARLIGLTSKGIT